MTTNKQKNKKKLGRPSKVELLEKETKRITEENKIKEKLIASLVSQETPGIFKVEARVQQIDALLVEGIPRLLGDVLRQDIGSNLVFVAWYNGCKYWTHAQCLELQPEKRKKSSG